MRYGTSTTHRLVAGIALAGLALAACGDDDEGSGSGGTITIGSADFSENILLAEIYGQALERGGYTFELKSAIGSREIYYKAIVDGEVDVVPEYTNSLLSFVLRQTDEAAVPSATNVDEQIAELDGALPDELRVLTPSAAEDKDVIVCSQAIADQYSLATLSDLAAVSGEITLGAPAEFETRSPFGLVGFAEIYGADFEEFVPLPYSDIATTISSGGIDCGNMFSTNPVITTDGLVPLADDKVIVPNEAILPLIRDDAASDEVVAILDTVSGALTTELLTSMLVEVDIDKTGTAEVAAEFVATLDIEEG